MFMPNCIHTKRLGVILGIAISTIIAGCGSGDGVGRNVAAAASDICTLSSGENPICAYYNVTVSADTLAAARSVPSAGDLFQSSEGIGDSITASVTISRTKLNYEVVRTPGSGPRTAFSVNNGAQDHNVIGTVTVVSPSIVTVTIGNVLLYSETSGATAYVDMIHDYSVTVDLTTTAALAIDSDYMVAGVWALRRSATDYEIGAFADGRQPFTVGNIARLINTATYTGQAIGLWTSATSTTEGASSLFDGTVSLTADFNTDMILGEVNGIVGIPGSPTITLESAVISSSAEGGFFTGNTRMVLSPTETLTGKWGGEFFGNEASVSDTNYPKSTAGTFGGAAGSGANARSYVGAFLGYK